MDSKINIPNKLPILPVRDAVVFPYMLLSLYVGRESSKKAIEEALNKSRIIFLSSQKSADEESISDSSVFKVGTAGIILRMRMMKDERMKVLVQGLSRALIKDIYEKNSHYEVDIEEIQDPEVVDLSPKTLKLMNTVKENLKTITALGGSSSPDMLMILDEVNQPGKLADFIAGHCELKMHEMQNILETFDPEKRLSRLQQILNKEVEIIRMQNRIKKMVKNNLSRFPNEPLLNNSHPYFSHPTQEPKTEEARELIQKVKEAEMPEKARQETLKQISRLEKMHPESSEASMIRGYLDWVVELPWNKSTNDNLDLQRARNILEKDHFGLYEVKERILEFLAVRKLRTDSQVKGPILCFTGPPGVGKTSLGKSIATAMERKYYRVSLGGVKDEAEIRGHRRTYVGAMPGKIIQALKQAQSNNPILVLDEVDKLGADFRGDPSSALLEVLDPEQNCLFRDHYINLNFDLSKVMFIATANLLENIPYALKDRMEIITLSGYTPKEKKEITKKYIINKEIQNNGINNMNISFTEKGINHLISHYTKEAGLRNLTREVGSLCRKVAKKVVLGEDIAFLITPEKINELLGPAKYLKEDRLKESKVGVSTGLAWTQAGGEILYVETVRISSSANKGIILTGQLGKVMEESAQAAYSYIRMYSEKAGISANWFKKNEIHIHLPAGATPKDGPSAGVTLATALISLITKTPVRKDIAMTGEIGLQGQVLPVGGIKEKALAALNHGILNVILPLKNKADIENTHSKDTTLKELRQKMNFIFVENLDEVFAIALEKTSPQRLREKPAVSIAS